MSSIRETKAPSLAKLMATTFRELPGEIAGWLRAAPSRTRAFIADFPALLRRRRVFFGSLAANFLIQLIVLIVIGSQMVKPYKLPEPVMPPPEVTMEPIPLEEPEPPPPVIIPKPSPEPTPPQPETTPTPVPEPTPQPQAAQPQPSPTPPKPEPPQPQPQPTPPAPPQPKAIPTPQPQPTPLPTPPAPPSPNPQPSRHNDRAPPSPNRNQQTDRDRSTRSTVPAPDLRVRAPLNAPMAVPNLPMAPTAGNPNSPSTSSNAANPGAPGAPGSQGSSGGPSSLFPQGSSGNVNFGSGNGFTRCTDPYDPRLTRAQRDRCLEQAGAGARGAQQLDAIGATRRRELDTAAAAQAADRAYRNSTLPGVEGANSDSPSAARGMRSPDGGTPGNASNPAGPPPPSRIRDMPEQYSPPAKVGPQ